MIARVSVTPQNLPSAETLDELVGLGFDGVFFAPVLNSPTGAGQLNQDELDTMLDGMIRCGHAFEQHLRQNEIYPFLNIINTLRRIHKPNRDAYPCGAGGGYLGVSAAGGLFACHRFIDSDLGAMGNIAVVAQTEIKLQMRTGPSKSAAASRARRTMPGSPCTQGCCRLPIR